jgi:hypothetical protein
MAGKERERESTTVKEDEEEKMLLWEEKYL